MGERWWAGIGEGSSSVNKVQQWLTVGDTGRPELMTEDLAECAGRSESSISPVPATLKPIQGSVASETMRNQTTECDAYASADVIKVDQSIYSEHGPQNCSGLYVTIVITTSVRTLIVRRVLFRKATLREFMPTLSASHAGKSRIASHIGDTGGD